METVVYLDLADDEIEVCIKGPTAFDYFTSPKSGEIERQEAYPYSKYGTDHLRFASIMGKFDPYAVFLRDPIEVSDLSFETLLPHVLKRQKGVSA